MIGYTKHSWGISGHEISFESVHSISCKNAYTPGEGSAQSAHPRSMIRRRRALLWIGLLKDPKRLNSNIHRRLLSACADAHVAFMLSLFVPRLSFFWCLGKVVFRNCGTDWRAD